MKEQIFDWTTKIAGTIFKVKPQNAAKPAIF
jgi:hypothetical protein